MFGKCHRYVLLTSGLYCKERLGNPGESPGKVRGKSGEFPGISVESVNSFLKIAAFSATFV